MKVVKLISKKILILSLCVSLIFVSISPQKVNATVVLPVIGAIAIEKLIEAVIVGGLLGAGLYDIASDGQLTEAITGEFISYNGLFLNSEPYIHGTEALKIPIANNGAGVIVPFSGGGSNPDPENNDPKYTSFKPTPEFLGMAALFIQQAFDKLTGSSVSPTIYNQLSTSTIDGLKSMGWTGQYDFALSGLINVLGYRQMINQGKVHVTFFESVPQLSSSALPFVYLNGIDYYYFSQFIGGTGSPLNMKWSGDTYSSSTSSGVSLVYGGIFTANVPIFSSFETARLYFQTGDNSLILNKTPDKYQLVQNTETYLSPLVGLPTDTYITPDTVNQYASRVKELVQENPNITTSEYEQIIEEVLPQVIEVTKVVVQPYTNPETNPGTDPGTQPGTQPGTNPGTQPGTQPGTEPGTQPGTDLGTDPGTETEVETEVDAGNWLINIVVKMTNYTSWFQRIVEILTGILDAVVGFFQPVFDVLTNIWEAIAEYLSPIFDTLTRIWESIESWLQPIFETLSNIGDAIAEYFQPMLDILTSIWEQLMSITWADLVTGFQTISETLTGVWNTITEWLQPIWEALNGIWNSVVEFLQPITEVVTNIWEYIREYLKPITEALTKIWEAILEFLQPISNVLTDIYNAILGNLQPLVDILTNIWTFTWTDLANWLESIVTNIDAIALAIKTWFVFDLDAVLAAISTISNVTTGIPIVGQFEHLGLIFAGYGNDSYEYPKIIIPTPSIIRQFYNSDEIVMVDFADYAIHFLWVRNIIKASLYIGLVLYIMRMFRVKLHIG